MSLLTKASHLFSLLDYLIKPEKQNFSLNVKHLRKPLTFLIQSSTCKIFYFVSVQSFAKTAGGQIIFVREIFIS